MNGSGLICLWAVACLFGPVSALAQEANSRTASPPAVLNSQAIIPRFIKFSGALHDMAAKRIVGVSEVTFALYTEETDGTALWYETQTIETDALGRYTVLLGAMHTEGVPVELFTSGQARWLGVQAGNLPETAQGGRVLLVSVPYALKAMDAETLGGKPASAFMLVPAESAQGSEPTNRTTPGTPKKNLTTGSGTQPKPLVTTNAATNFIDNNASQVVLVKQNGTGYGLFAQTPSNFAVFGQVTGTSGTTYAVTGIAAAPAGAGVLGESNATSGGGSGVLGVSNSSTGVGVYGKNLATTGLAVGTYGLTASSGGIALFGRATATTGATVGIGGRADSSSGIGLSGLASATSGTTIGLLAKVSSSTGIAAVFDNTAGGKIASMQKNGVEKLSVDASGNLTAAGNLVISGTAQINSPLRAGSYLDLAGNPLPFGVNGIKEYFASGTFTVPAGIRHIMVEMWGPGGGGGTSSGCGTTSRSIGGGGGGGAYTRTVVSVVAGATYSIVVGAGGTAPGGNGGTTEILDPSSNVLAHAGGGQGGTATAGGAGGAADSTAMISHPGIPGPWVSGASSTVAEGGATYSFNLAPWTPQVVPPVYGGGNTGCNTVGAFTNAGSPGYVLITW
jgi:hypothetical protein